VKSCYFCGSRKVKSSLLQRKICFDSQSFSFHLCRQCFGFSLYPKLSDVQIQKLYSLEYVSNLSAMEDESQIDGNNSSNRFGQLHEYLKANHFLAESQFLDYGCGASPETFEMVRNFGLNPSGMEYSQDVREKVMAISKVTVFSPEDILKSERMYDVIFLGDVLEHLIEPKLELEMLKSKLKPNGVLIAQGPLQAAWTLTHLAVMVYTICTRQRLSDFPPYHVSLATRNSMLNLLNSSGFSSTQIKCTEVTWPAPEATALISKPSVRDFVLIFCKTVDKAVSRVVKQYGSRYFSVSHAGDKSREFLK
jgi:trans-aconitate methyltransferase